MSYKSSTDLGVRRDRLLLERVHDPYKAPNKLPEPTVCPECGAVYHEGRWQWASRTPEGAHRTLCQACQRKQDNYPAGIITMSGHYVRKHREELINLARNREAEEIREHPLHRILSIEEGPDWMVIKTTDIHLPHNIAESLRDAHQGDLNIQYPTEEYFLRAEWRRKE